MSEKITTFIKEIDKIRKGGSPVEMTTDAMLAWLSRFGKPEVRLFEMECLEKEYSYWTAKVEFRTPLGTSSECSTLPLKEEFETPNDALAALVKIVKETFPET